MCSPSERSGNFDQSMTTDSFAPSSWRQGFARALLLLAVFGSFSATCEAQQEDSPFAGTWSGVIPLTLFSSDAPGGESLRTRRYQFRIAPNGKVRVLGNSRQLGQRAGRWGELWISFVLIEVGGGAVISGQNGTDFWAESQTFSLTKVDEDTLLVYLWRVVDNFGAPLWAAGGYAEFQRAGRRPRERPVMPPQ
jgi:hypothetical protein